MQILVPLVACLALAACATARRSATPAAGAPHAYPATSPAIRVMGRHAADGDAIAFGASGVTFHMKFRGTALEVDIDETPHDSAGHDWFTTVVDGGEPVRFRADAGTHRYTLARELADGVHTIALSKATEGQNGRERLIAVHAATLLPADASPARRIEIIGNSITAGYGLDPSPIACGAGPWYDQTHAWLAYGPRVARRLNAQWMLSAISGIGVVRDWGSPGPTMPAVYRGVYMAYDDSLTTWDSTRYAPDLVIVELGTNDFSAGGGPTPRAALDGDAFVATYARFLAGVRARYPSARQMLLGSAMLDSARSARLGDYLQRVIAARGAAGDSGVARYDFPHRYTAGCNGHPSLEQQARMADELEPAVRAWMRW